MDRLIDFHTHYYPSEAARNPLAFAQRYGETHWGEVVARPRQQGGLQDWPDEKTFLAEMDRAKVEIAVLQGWYWENPDTCAVQNRWHQVVWSRHRERLRVFAPFHPGGGEASLRVVQEAVRQGASGVGELCPAAQGYGWGDPVFAALLRWAENHRVPVLFHVTEAVGRDYPGRVETPLRDFLETARRFPDLRMILAHWGGGVPFFELGKGNANELRNVSYDSAAAPLVYADEAYSAMESLVGKEKLLFGSDYPLRIYPRLPAGEGREKLIATARKAYATTTQERFFRENALALLTR